MQKIFERRQNIKKDITITNSVFKDSASCSIKENSLGEPKPVSADQYAGEIFTELTIDILGKSGSGKNITLMYISGIETLNKWKIMLNNRILFSSEKKINMQLTGVAE